MESDLDDLFNGEATGRNAATERLALD